MKYFLHAAASTLVVPALLLSAGPVLAGPFPPDAAAYTSPQGDSSRRAALADAIVAKWVDHVIEAYGTSAAWWTNAMAPTFARVPQASLERALQARTFTDMNRALEGSAAGAVAPKALGDAAGDLVFVPITPCRIADTRVAGGVIPANSTRNFDVTDVANYTTQGGDASDCGGAGAAGSFAAAAFNFTVVTPSGNGYITAYPYLATQPLASTLNYQAGDVRGNFAVVRLDQGAAAPELSVYSFAQTHLVIDMVGYFIAPQATNLGCTSTAVSSFVISANTINFYFNPACPAGYTATQPYCWTASAGVYHQGSGYSNNTVGSSTFCAWQNTTAASQTVFGGNVCCRVPGR